MIVSREHRFVFVEVPFTGSTAIAKELVEQYGCEEVLHKHAHLREFLNQATVEEKRYTVAASTRHPLDQTLSYYTKLCSNHLGSFSDPQRFKENGGWVTHANREHFQFVSVPAHDFADFLRRYYIGQSVRISQYAWGRSRYDHLLRFETLNPDFQSVLRALDIPPKRDLPLTNPTQGRDRDFLSAYPEDLHAPLCAVLGPLIAEWGYELPDTWRSTTSLANRTAYFLKNLLGRFATELLHLTPADYHTLRAKLGRE